MLYRLYCSSGNTSGIDEYVCYSEIGADESWVRYVEIKSDGTALRYDREHAADLFRAVWSVTRCVNDDSGLNQVAT